jgi:RNA-binding protein
MRAVGEVVRTAQGLAVLRSDDDGHPDIGTPVVDERLETVGRVVDVFGPVERPYLAVSPADGVAVPALLGDRLYAE